MRKAIKIENEISMDSVKFKRCAKTLKEHFEKRDSNKPLSLGEVHEILAISMGYPNYHNLQKEAAHAEYVKDNPLDFHERIKKQREESLKKDSPWLKDIFPANLLQKRSWSWCDDSLHLTKSTSFMSYGKPNDQPGVTVIVGQYSDIVLEAWAKLHDSSMLFDLQKENFKKISNALPPAYKANSNTGKGIPVRHVGHYFCIKGLMDEPISADKISGLVGLISYDYGADFAISVARADLIALTSPDFDRPHFHYLRILDLDELTDQPNRAISHVWTKDEYEDAYRWPRRS